MRQCHHVYKSILQEDSVESASAIMKGYELFYNFVKKHEAPKGKTPSEVAIQNLKFKTPNRWLELIEMSKTTAQNKVYVT